MPRLFTAIQIPRPIGQTLAFLRGGLPGARWMEPEDYHITLSFVGDIGGGLAADIAEGLYGVARPRFTLEFQGLDVFGRDKPEALYAAVHPSQFLFELQTAQERVLRRLGAPLENRHYKPHVTLARLRNVSARLVADWLAMHGDGGRQSFTVERYALMSSRDSKGGGPYLVEEVYSLG